MTAPTVSEPPTDQALAAAYAGGDQRAATELVRRHADPLARFLYGAGAAVEEVEDLVQEALFRAFRGLPGWRRDASFRSWLFTIGGNLLKDDARRRRGKLMLSLEDRDLPDGSDPHAELAAGEAEERVRRGLAGLSRLQREVFLLRAQQGAGYDDIASALGTTPGAARVHYHHAVKRLKELVR
jgi:RNA polymerase sigma-70 factor (ECF subfamily)